MRLALLALCATTMGALPCRYTVRDIGFVELAGPIWQLAHVEGPDSSLAEGERAALEEALAHSNVRFAPTPEALAEEGAWVLLGAGRAPLLLGTRDLIAAQGYALRSPLRSRFAEQALDSFAFLLLVDGREQEANERAWAALEEARTGLSALAPQLPRQIEDPLRSMRVEWGEREAERVLLWSMGVDLADERPAALVLYGRGVRAGAPLVGDAITSARLLDWLALIGESCECDTERDWSAEPAFPLAWGRQDNQDVSAALGFDPESPWVQREVASILQRGAWTKPPGRGAQALEQDALAAVLGFRVGELAGTGQEPTGLPLEEEPGSGTLLVRSEGSGDWDFAEEPRAVTPGAVMPSAVTPSAVTPSAVTPSAVTPSAVTPSAVTPSAVTPSAVTPSAVTPSAVRPASPAPTERSERVSELPVEESASLVQVGLVLGALTLLSLGGAVLVALTRSRR